MHLAPDSKQLIGYLVAYPFIIRALYLLRQSVEPFYMNATCLIDLVRESSPEHYDLHPLWKYYQQNSNITCTDITGMEIEDYFNHIYKNGTTEFYIFYGIAFAFAGYGLICFLKQLFTGKVKSFIGVLGCAILSWNHGSLFHLLAHYQNDLSHINGNVMHHSSFNVGGDNAALVNTLPPGLLINFMQNFVTVWMMMYVILDYLKVDKWLYLNLSGPLILAKFFLQMKIIHPFIHTQHKSWYGTFISPLISKYIMDDYKGHVLCHHVDGYCLGDSPVYGWYYDWVLYYHGKLYELGYLRFQEASHYISNILLDYFLLVSCFVMMVVTVFVMYPLLPKAVQAEASKAKAQ